MGTVNSKNNNLNNMANAMTHLTKEQAEVIQMYCCQGMTLDAIAEKLGLSRFSVQSRLNTAMKKLRKI